MGLDLFWAEIDRQLNELKDAKSASDVIRIVGPGEPGQAAGPGFFAGSGGNETVLDSLVEADWEIAWFKAPYFWAAKAPDGTRVTYVEGDIYPELQRPPG